LWQKENLIMLSLSKDATPAGPRPADSGRRAFVVAGLRISALAGLGLAGCRTPAPRNGVPELTFAHLAPIPLQVARLEVDNQYMPSQGMPTIESTAPIAPADAVRRWAERRLQPVGANGRALVAIYDAMLAQIPLARTTGLTGMVTTDQSDEYRVRIDVEVICDGLPSAAPVSARAFAERARTVSEDVSLQQRDEVVYRLVEEAMIAINTELERQILAGFGAYLG
jgi:hypothetical protein